MSHSIKSHEPILASESELSHFIECVCNGTWPHSQWTHAAHVALGASLTFAFAGQCETALRRTIWNYNESQGTANTIDNGYHETLTMFWLSVIREHLRDLPVGTTRLEAVRSTVETFGSRSRLYREFYSYDVVKSREARRMWIEPDLRPLACPPNPI